MQTLVMLQHALEVGGARIQNVRLREINGHDERRLAEVRGIVPAFLQSAELLGRVAEFEGLPEGLGREAVNSLSVGDRVLLMLHLRRQALGDVMHCTLDCPECTKKMSLDISVGTLIGQRMHAPANASVTVGDLSMEIRAATHLDQKLLLSNDAEGMQAFASSCIVFCEPPFPSGAAKEAAVAAVNQKLKDIDPLADIVLELKCPECRHSFDAPFDPEEFFLEEIAMRSRQLDWDVHWLAFNYHWSEESILTLTAGKRRRYIELINDSLSGETP